MKVLGNFVKLLLEDFNNSGLNKVVTTIKNVVSALTPGEKILNNLSRSFYGILAVLDILAELVGSFLVPILEAFGFTISSVGGGVLDITANIGDLLCQFRDWVLENQVIQRTFGVVGKIIAEVIKYIGKLINKVEDSGVVSKAFISIGEAFEWLFNLISGQAPNVTVVLSDFKDSLVGLAQDFSFDNLVSTVKDLGSSILGLKDNIGEVTTVVTSTGNSVPKLKSSFTGVTTVIGTFIDKIKSLISFENAAKVTAIAIGATSIKLGLSIAKLIDKITAIKDPISVLTSGIKNFFDTLSYSVAQIGKSVSRAANAVALKNFAQAILMLVAAIAVLALLPDKSAIQESLVTIGLLVVTMAAVMKLMTITPAGTASMASIAAAFLGLAVAISVMGGVVAEMKLVANTIETFSDSIKVLTLLVGSAGLLVTFTYMVKGITKDLSKSVLLLIPIAASLYVFALGLQKLASVDIGNLGEFMLKLIVFFGYFKVVSTMAESLTGGAALALISISATVIIFADAIKRMANVGWDNVLLALPGMLECILFIKIILKALTSTKKDAIKAGATILAVAAAIDLMIIAIKAFGKMTMTEVLKATAMMTPIMVLFEGIIAVTAFAGKNAAKAGVTLVAMAVSVSLLAVAISLLSMLDEDAVDRATKCIQKIMAMCAVIIASTGLASSASKTVAMIAVLMGTLTGSLAILTLLDQDKLQSSIKSMSMIIAALSVMFLTVGALGKPSKESLVTIGIITGVVTAISTLFAILSALSDADAMLKIAESISMVLLSMAGVMAVAALVGTIGGAATAGLTTMLTTIGIIAGILGAIGSLINALGISDEVLSALDLMTQIFEKVGEALGSIIGGAVNGLLTSATKDIVDVANNLSDFAEALEPFLTTIKGMDSSSIEAVGTLVDVIKSLAAGKISDKLGKIFGSNDDELKVRFEELGEAIKAFSDKASGIKTETFKTAVDASKYLSEILENLPKSGGLSGLIFGSSDLSKFSDNLESYGDALSSFSDAVSNKDFDPDAIKKAAKASKSLVELINNLPESGGWIQGIFGGYDLEKFGNQLDAYADCLSSITSKLKDSNFDSKAAKLLKQAASATKPLVEICSNLESSGGSIQNIIGEKNLSEFGSKLEDYISSLVSISDTLEGNPPDYTAISNASQCSKNLIELCESLPTSGGLSGWFSGEQDFSQFGSNIEDYGDSLKNFGLKIKDVDTGKLQTGITQSKNLVSMLRDVSTNAGVITEGESYFSSALTDFGIAIQTYYECIKDVAEDKVVKIANASNTMMNIGKSIKSSNPTMWKTFGDSLSAFGDKFANFYDKIKSIETVKLGMLTTSFKGISELTKSLKSISGASFSNVSTAFNEVGKISITNMNSQFVTGKKTVISSINSLMNGVIESIRSRRSDMAQSATYVCMGFVNGVNGNLGGIQNAGTSVGRKFLTAMNAALDINSPSKETESSGEYTVEGFVNGIESKVKTVTYAASTVASSAIEGVSKTVKGSSGLFTDGVNYLVDTAKQAIKDTQTELSNAATSSVTSTLNSTTTATNSSIDSSTKSTTKAATKSVKKSAKTTAKAARKAFKNVGKEILIALNDGVTKGKYQTSAKASVNTLVSIGKNVAEQVKKQLKQSTGIFDDYWESLSESSEKATTKTTATLQEAANAYTKFKDSIKESLESVMDGFKAFEASSESVSTSDIISNLNSQISATKNFKVFVKALKAMGYSNEVIKTVTDMGVADGTVYAEALLAATTSQVKKINSKTATKKSLAESSADVISSVFVSAEKSASKAAKKLAATTKETISTAKSIELSVDESTKALSTLSEEAVEKFKELGAEAGLSDTIIQNLINNNESFVSTILSLGDAAVTHLGAIATAEKANVEAIYNSMTYGVEAAKEYIAHFDTANNTTRTSTEAAKAAKEAIEAYAKKIYLTTDAGKEEQAAIDDLNTKLKDQQSTLSKLIKLRDKYANSSKYGKESTKYKDTVAQITAWKKIIAQTQSEIKSKNDTLTESIASNWSSLSSSITESFKNAMSGLSISYDTGIDAFKEYTQDTETSMSTMLTNFQSQLNAYATYRNNLLTLYEMKENGQITQATYDYIAALGRDGEAYLNAVVNATDSERQQLDDLLTQNTQATSETLIQNAKQQAANLVKYQNLLIDLADRGFDANTLYELLDSGYSEANLALAEAYDALNDDQIQEWNDVQATGEEAASTAASKILAAFSGETEKSGNVIQSLLAGDAGALTTAVTTAVSDALETVSSEVDSQATGKTVIFGIAEGISKNTSTLVNKAEKVSKKTNDGTSKYLNSSSGYSIGYQMCSGLVVGIQRNTGMVVTAAENMARAAKAASEAILDIASPSKVYAQIGKYCAIGMANGINNSISVVSEAGTNLGEETLKSTQSIASKIQDILDSGIDVSPTITPVLDISQVSKDAQRLSTLMSRTKAMSVYSGIEQSKANRLSAEAQSKQVTVNNNYNMEQNNYSPRALSNIDIYRQTKNQMSALKGVQNSAKIRYSYQ
jgi:hypothetical protein